MDLLVLTKVGGFFLWRWLVEILGLIMNVLFKFTSMFGITNIGLCILLFTIVTKTILLPLSVKQQKSSKLMNVMQPELQAIQRKYKGKTDNESAMKMNVETRAVYEKYGTSMTGGCLPMLIQLPIMFGLYQIIYKIPAYVSSVRHYFDLITAKLPADFMNNPAFQELSKSITLQNKDFSNMNVVVDMLYRLTDKQWNQMTAAFPEIANVVTESGENVIQGIIRMQQFLGMNISYTPLSVITGYFSEGNGTILAVIMAVLIPVLSGVFQWYSTKLITAAQPQQSDDAPGSSMMKSMNVTMPLMSVVFCFTFPLVIGIYWVASSLYQVVQQIGMNAYLEKVDVNEMIRVNVEKANKKRAKKGLQPTKVSTITQNLQKIQESEEKEKARMSEKIEKTKKIVEESTQYYNKDAKPGSLASKVNMVQKYNEKEKNNKK